MTPQERQLVADLFDRLAGLESAPRDADAERAIAAGLVRAPHAIYPLTQTVLLQDEALRRANDRIRELEGTGEPAGGFLDNMRGALFGGPKSSATSVPTVRPSAAGGPYRDAALQSDAQRSSFLGTAAASAVGVIGGMMMANLIGSLLGQNSSSAQAFASPAPAERTPWEPPSTKGELARDAGVSDIADDSRRTGLFDSSAGFDDGSDSGPGDDFGGD